MGQSQLVYIICIMAKVRYALFCLALRLNCHSLNWLIPITAESPAISHFLPLPLWHVLRMMMILCQLLSCHSTMMLVTPLFDWSIPSSLLPLWPPLTSLTSLPPQMPPQIIQSRRAAAEGVNMPALFVESRRTGELKGGFPLEQGRASL